MSNPNPYTGDPFSLETRTASINRQPYRPGQISALGLFEEDGVTTTMISIERQDGKLGLVDPTERGGPGETTDQEDRDGVPIKIPHYQRDDAIKADEVQNVRAFGTDNTPETIEGRLAARDRRHGQDLTMTLEHQRVGAIKGIVTSKSGGTLLDLYSAFGIALPAAVSLELDVDTTIVSDLFQDVRYAIEDALDQPYDGIHVFTGRDFHKALWTHKSVRETFMYNAGAAVLRNDVPDVFEFCGATWERYKTGTKATANLGSAYIAANEARVCMTGVPGLYITRFAPADYNETVNTMGLPFYSKAIEMLNGKGYDYEAQMNAISICTMPETLRKLTLT
ncbi:major capsid protein [Martelella sp. HB161492]|uniref:major capsid protein n=1 Tax=Martelella sp. HB161492 TaxID=2720726 RepID=UPI001590CEFF|nr:major capsid protein [Martelella sp. HB161492]